MCTVIVLVRPGDPWPTLIGANRDERIDRGWDPPAAWWPEHRDIVGGRDRSAGGTWMAVNAHGVVAAVLNRPGSLGPEPGKRSRGELPLLALSGVPSAAAAAQRVRDLPATKWRPYNMVLADRHGAWFLRGLGRAHAEAMPLPAGLSMVTAHDPNDLASPRTRRHLPRFRTARPPDPMREDWTGWETLLADDTYEWNVSEALCVPPVGGFGTVSSSLLALGEGGEALWRFAPGPAGAAAFAPVPLPTLAPR